MLRGFGLVLVFIGAAVAALSQADINTLLTLHNNERAKVCVGAVTWSATVAATAQTWANKCTMSHSSGSGYGENLAWGSGGYSVGALTQLWINEKNGYSCSTQYSSAAGHYTQMVWKATTQIGCAVATCGSQVYLVCNYNPPGNYIGQSPYPCSQNCNPSATTTGPAPVTTGSPAPVTTGSPAPATSGPPAPVTTGSPVPATTGSANTDVGNCRTVHNTRGCNNQCISTCVCRSDSWCCRYNWDIYCVSEVTQFGCASPCGVVINQNEVINTTSYVRSGDEMSGGVTVQMSLAMLVAAWVLFAFALQL